MASRAGAYDEQPLRMPGLSSSHSQSVPPARNVILFLLSDPESLKKSYQPHCLHFLKWGEPLATAVMGHYHLNPTS